MAVVGLAIDLWTKVWAFKTVAGSPVVVSREEVLSSGWLGRLIPQHDPVTVIPNILDFTLVLNPGAVFGMGAGKRWFFVVFTGAALAFGLMLFARWTKRNDTWAHISVALLLAGGLGNLYDRLVFGCVRDFIHPLPGVRLPFGIRWPGGGNEVWPWVSNVADLWLIIGIGILVLRTLRTPPAPRNTATS
ncbi:MAG: signal peptidase II [Planctomycetes bacterium]|nr:signal peptidase II [Planctomycetota bacterium]